MRLLLRLDEMARHFDLTTRAQNLDQDKLAIAPRHAGMDRIEASPAGYDLHPLALCEHGAWAWAAEAANG
jgi:hypothetical protein